MLYLISQPGPISSKILYKVGYSYDLDKRLGDYKTSYPYRSIVHTREGDSNTEYLLHKIFHFIFKDVEFYKNEWYLVDYYNKSIPNFFKNFTTDQLDDLVWENRSRIFSSLSDRDLEIYASIYFSKRRFTQQRIKVDADMLVKMRKQVRRSTYEIQGYDEINRDSIELIGKGTFKERMELYCNLRANWTFHTYMTELILNNHENSLYEDYYSILGFNKCRDLDYNEKCLEKERVKLAINNKALYEIRRSFVEGYNYSPEYIVSKLSSIYNRNSINITPVESDILNYFCADRQVGGEESDDYRICYPTSKWFKIKDSEVYYHIFGIKDDPIITYSCDPKDVELRKSIYTSFVSESWISTKDVESVLSDIYRSLGINKLAEASDLKEYFDIDDITVLDESTGNILNCYYIDFIK